MKFRIEKSFDRDADRVKNKKVLRKLRDLLSTIEDADTIQEIPHAKRLKATDHTTGLKSVIIVWAWRQCQKQR